MQVRVVENVVLPNGEYLCQVAEIESVKGNFGPQFRWKFEIVVPDEYQGKTLAGWTSVSVSQKSQFVTWASACLGREIGPGEQLNTDDLIGTLVVLAVTVQEKKDGGQFNKIEGVRVNKKLKPAPTPQPVPEDDECDPFA